MGLTNEDLQEILRLLDASTFDELRLETDQLKLVLRRRGAEPEADPLDAPPQSSEPAAGSDRRPSDVTVGARQRMELVPHDATQNLHEIKAPMLGTFYSRPKPGAAPFVEAGSKVRNDSTIGIIEVMKLMNSIPAGIGGEIVEVCVADGTLVEFGQVLIRIRPEA
jgi:acetyl-CoA carboxylase biotin carboxyl carrier protein